MKKWFQKFQKLSSRIGLVDGFLLIFLAVLFCYTGCSLFLFPPNSDSGSVDIIVRTSAAAIFGYFLSYNSMQTPVSVQKDSEKSDPLSTLLPGRDSSAPTRAQIGFSLAPSSGELASGGASSSNITGSNRHAGFQIIVVSCLGLLSLILLFVIREKISDSTAVTATASQLRDFVSASVGFLVSCGKNMRKG